MKEKKSNISDIIELVLAVIVPLLALLIGMRDLMMSSNDVYPVTSDAMGHLSKVKYIAECFKEFKIPHWFPNWYNGSTVSQYYPPLSYMIMAPIQMITNNVMVTYKIFCALSIFTGALGVWLFCKKFIGDWCGIFGAFIYCIEPFLLRSLLSAGVLAQGPVFMISPWFLYSVLSYVFNPKRSLWAINTILTALLILSHAMHAYMMSFCMMLILLVFAIFKKIDFKNYVLLGLSIGMGGMITAVWAIQGATRLENPTIPYLLEEATLIYTATLDWYNGINKISGKLYLHLVFLIVGVISAVLYSIANIRKKNGTTDRNDYVEYSLLLFFFTLVFSFGRHLPFFNLIPLYKSLVPGRILSLTAVCTGILCAYLVYRASKIGRYRITGSFLSLSICVLITIGVNPLETHSYTLDVNKTYERIMTKIGKDGSNFDKGRYTWLASVFSWETYFPVIYNFNTTDGWNIEGTPHNTAIWLHNIALVGNCEDYVIKNLLSWNVRSLLVDKSYERLIEKLTKEYHFYGIDGYDRFTVLKNDTPSSYYLRDQRDTTVVGIDGDGLAMTFPWIVRGTRQKLSNKDINEFEEYKTVYFNEPNMESLYDVKNFENLVRELVKKGKTVIIETNSNQNFTLFGVSPHDVVVDQNTVLQLNEKSRFKSDIKSFEFKQRDIAKAYIGLDKVYYTLDKKGGTLTNDIIGEKHIPEGSVYFVGMAMSQYLTSSQIKRSGYSPNNSDYEYYKPIEKIMESVLVIGHPNKEFKPEPFPVIDHQWTYNGGMFEYTSDVDADVVISVTYTPRWEITLDEHKINARSKENLIQVHLPAGTHRVKLHYGMTKYGRIGTAVTFIGFITALLILVWYRRLVNMVYNTMDKVYKKLNINEQHIKSPI